MFIQPEQLEHAGTGPDGLARWWVRFPHLRYDGKVLAPADWTLAQVHEALEEWAKPRGSDAVAQGQLWSPRRLGE